MEGEGKEGGEVRGSGRSEIVWGGGRGVKGREGWG